MKTVQSWAVKHRPQQFDDVVGQDDAVSRLKGYIKRGEIPNAIMFTGPSGTGKTTLARIFARYLNCATNDTCGTCPSCKATPHPDIDESNAGEARGIDDMRALVNKAKYKPRFNVRVFIIDEAHQLTPQSREAFLKPLEEPPPNTMYILCTTDPQKFPTTIVNRCTVINLDRPDVDAVVSRLRVVAKAEKQKLPKGLCTAIAEATGGCVREAITVLSDAISLLAEKPDMPPEKLISTVSQLGDAATAVVSTKILIGLYNSKPSVVARAVFDMQDAVQTINLCMWFNEYLLAQLLKSQTKAVFHSPANRDFAAAARKQCPDLKVSDVLFAQRRLVNLRNQMHNVPTKEVSMMLAVLTDD